MNDRSAGHLRSSEVWLMNTRRGPAFATMPASDETAPVSLGSTEWEQIGSNPSR